MRQIVALIVIAAISLSPLSYAAEYTVGSQVKSEVGLTNPLPAGVYSLKWTINFDPNYLAAKSLEVIKEAADKYQVLGDDGKSINGSVEGIVNPTVDEVIATQTFDLIAPTPIVDGKAQNTELAITKLTAYDSKGRAFDMQISTDGTQFAVAPEAPMPTVGAFFRVRPVTP